MTDRTTIAGGCAQVDAGKQARSVVNSAASAGRARRDVEFALVATLERFTTRAAQGRALEVLQFKLDILWQMNGAMALAYGVTT
jgi:hypothetical protein